VKGGGRNKMNFDTRYLIRWGIPGWIFIIFSSVYFLLRDFKGMINLLPTGSGTSIVAAGAILTVLGIPIGYLFNQIHHTLTFVVLIWIKKVIDYKWIRWLKLEIPEWDHYFKFESKFEDYLYTHDNEKKESSGEKIHERYKYLLSRIHEIGGICFAIIFSEIIVIIWESDNGIALSLEVWIYHIFIIVVFWIMWIDRSYYKRNIEVFINYHSDKAKIPKYYRD
jgi:hypothetical protein